MSAQAELTGSSVWSAPARTRAAVALVYSSSRMKADSRTRGSFRVTAATVGLKAQCLMINDHLTLTVLDLVFTCCVKKKKISYRKKDTKRRAGALPRFQGMDVTSPRPARSNQVFSMGEHNIIHIHVVKHLPAIVGVALLLLVLVLLAGAIWGLNARKTYNFILACARLGAKAPGLHAIVCHAGE